MGQISKRHTSLLSLIAFGIMSGCGSQSAPNAPSQFNSSDSKSKNSGMVEGTFDEIVHPPREYHDAAMAKQFQLLSSRTQLLANDSILYVNFDGATVRKGYGVGESFIVCGSQANIPSAGLGGNEREQILAMVHAYYQKAGAALTVVQTKPSNGVYTTIHVGGSYGDLGCLDRPGVLGVAPYDVGNSDPSDVGFAFTKRTSDLETIATTVAHEAAHTFGLDHVENQKCIMYPSVNSQIEGFAVGRVSGGTRTQDGPALLRTALGVGPGGVDPSSPTPTVAPTVAPTTAPSIPGLPNLPPGLANLPGLDVLASLGKLVPQLDPTQILNVTNLISQLANFMPGGLPIVNGLIDLDKLMSVVQLATQATGTVPNSPTTPANTTLLQKILTSSTTQAGGIGGLFNVLSPTTPSTVPAAKPIPLPLNAVPELDALLGMKSFSNVGELCQSMNNHARVVNQNFTGGSRDALLSMLKVSYSQAYVKSFAK